MNTVEVGAEISDILKKKNEALSRARSYRSWCADLQKRIRKLENEKETFGATRLLDNLKSAEC